MIGLATATSGVAASILPGGRTAHSRFEIPLQTNESTMTNMSKQSGVRVGNGDEPTIRDNLILLPEQLTVKHSRDGFPEESIIQEIFPNLQENAATAKYVTERAILASRNDHVDKLNDKLIAMFPGESKIFNSFDSAEDDTNNYYQEEYLNTLTPNGLPPHRY